jgi:predicted enzyme related to lactoylglutathione lyase
MAKKTSKTKKTKKKAKSAKKSKRAPAKKPATARRPKKRSAKTSKRLDPLAIRGQHVDFLSYKVEQVRKFYEDVLELKTEVRDTEGLNYLFVRTSSSSSLGFMPPHPEMKGEQPLPREPTLYFYVADVERVHAQLTSKGVGFNGPPQDMPWGDRVVTTTDPEGRTVMLASKLPKEK